MNPTFEQDLEEAFEFRENLTPETDRGCALMAAAYLDTRLGELLTQHFVDDPKIVSGFLEQQDRPLSTFSSRIDLAYLLGLISRDERGALHSIRKIRNEFAHVSKPITFDAHKLTDHCKKLAAFNFYQRTTHRGMFTAAVMMLLAGMNARLRSIEHCKVRPDVDLARAVEEDPNLVLYGALLKFVRALDKESAKKELLEAIVGLFEAGNKDAREFAEKLVTRIVGKLSKPAG